jgi:nicotinamide-nucleotide amidase
MSGLRAEFVAIGSELLGPWGVETNGSYLARRLGEIGIAIRFRTAVGDVQEEIAETVRIALGRSDLVVATGGLGPTIDDRTREAVAGLLGLPLEEDPGLLRGIEARFRRHGLAMPPQNRRQALVPRGAEVLPNPIGTAPGLLLRAGPARIALLPGVPSEMQAIVEESLLPRLAGAGGGRLAHRVLKIAGLTESEVDRRLDAVARAAGEVEWTILAAPGQVEIRLRERVAAGTAPAGIARLEQEIAAALGPHLFGRDEETMEEVVGRLLAAAGATVATAESLTGGLVGARLTAVAGASAYFRGGAVCYSDGAKRSVLGVAQATLAAHTAVSEPVAQEMARGARTLFEADWGVAATGYAGPAAGGPERPAGTVALAVSGPGLSRARLLHLPGDRGMVRARAAQSALDLLRRALLCVPE